MTELDKIIKDIEYGKDLLQNRPEQDTVDYKVWEILDDALKQINDMRQQIIMLVGAQHSIADLMKNPERLEVEQQLDETYGVYGGTCPTCGNWIQSAHSFCGFCGQPIVWKKRNQQTNIKEPCCLICSQQTCKHWHENEQPEECKSYMRGNLK